MTDIPFAQIERRQVERRPRHPDHPGRRLAAAVHGDRHAAVHRQPRAPGDAADRRPQGDARAGAVRLRPRRQRPLLAVRRLLHEHACRSASRTSRRPSRCSRRPGRTAPRSTCTRPTAPPAWSTRPTSSPHRRRTRASPSTSTTTRNYYGNQYLKLRVLGRLLGHAQLPAPGREQHAARRAALQGAVQRDPLAAQVRPGSNFIDLYKQAPTEVDPGKRMRHHPRDADAGVQLRAATSSRSSTTWSTPTAARCPGSCRASRR